MPIGAPTPDKRRQPKAPSRVADEEAFGVDEAPAPAGSPAPPGSPAAAAPAAPAWLNKDGLMAFYRTYKPEYATASQVSTILAKYKGRERTLATMLARKYGPALVAAEQHAVRLEVARHAAPKPSVASRPALKPANAPAAPAPARAASPPAKENAPAVSPRPSPTNPVTEWLAKHAVPRKPRSPSPNPFVDAAPATVTPPRRAPEKPVDEAASLAAAIRSLDAERRGGPRRAWPRGLLVGALVAAALAAPRWRRCECPPAPAAAPRAADEASDPFLLLDAPLDDGALVRVDARGLEQAEGVQRHAVVAVEVAELGGAAVADVEAAEPEAVAEEITVAKEFAPAPPPASVATPQARGVVRKIASHGLMMVCGAVLGPHVRGSAIAARVVSMLAPRLAKLGPLLGIAKARVGPVVAATWARARGIAVPCARGIVVP